MKTRQLVIMLGIFALCSAVTAAAIAEPGGTPPVPSPSVTRSFDAVTDTAEELGSFWAEPGFGKTVVDYGAATVTVHWKGVPPREVAERAASNESGVKVVIKPATYSDAELVAASRAILDMERKRTGPQTIAAVLPNADLSGLIVEVTTGTVAAKEPSLAKARYEALTDIPIAIELVAEDPVLTTRQNDAAPWQGGGAMADSSG